MPLLQSLNIEATSYGREGDGWLRLSQAFWKQRRVGQGGDEIFKSPYLTAIDLDRVTEAPNLGHDLLSLAIVIDDLGDWFADNKRPDQDSRFRRWLKRYDALGVPYYQMR